MGPNTKEAQRDRLLQALKDRGSVSTCDAREDLNVMHPAGRIMELRRQGHGINTSLAWVADEEGRLHRQALYSLLAHDARGPQP